MHVPRRTLAVLFVLGGSACGDETIAKFDPVAGAPSAISALGFDPGGKAVVIGGGQVFGAKTLQREGVWQPAEGVPEAATGSLHDHDGELFAVLGGGIYRLDGVAAFAWTPLMNPAITRVHGIDGTGAFYGTDLQPGIRRWAAGDPSWALVPGSETVPLAERFAVARDGTVFTSIAGEHERIYRSTPAGTEVAADCATTPGCQYGLSHLTLDGDDNLYLLECPQIVEHRYAYVLRSGAATPSQLPALPQAYTFCLTLQALADGTLLLVIATDNTVRGDLAIFELRPGDSSWRRATADDPEAAVQVTQAGFTYVARDDSAIYGFGDGTFGYGLIRGTR